MEWYEVTKQDAKQIYFPSLKIQHAKSIIRQRKYSPTDSDYFWFHYPHSLEYQQSLKVTIYCTFDFSSYPFDSQICDFVYGSVSTPSKKLNLKPAAINFKNSLTKYGQTDLNIKQSRLPFEIKVASLESFEKFENGYNYSSAGMKIYLTRNDLGLLLGSFYGPTAIFSILSLISFSINLDIVSLLGRGFVYISL